MSLVGGLQNFEERKRSEIIYGKVQTETELLLKVSSCDEGVDLGKGQSSTTVKS
jgi:hypothetical protein